MSRKKNNDVRYYMDCVLHGFSGITWKALNGIAVLEKGKKRVKNAGNAFAKLLRTIFSSCVEFHCAHC